MALALLGLGAVGVFATLKTVTLGTAGVRDFDTATSVAQGWADRARADATAWISSTTFGGASLLARGADGNAFVPTVAYGSVSVQAGADLRGVDVAATDATARFCTALRYRCITGAAPDPTCPAVVTTAAVFWPREGAVAAASPFCTAQLALAAIPPNGADREASFDNVYRSVTVSTVVTPTLP